MRKAKIGISEKFEVVPLEVAKRVAAQEQRLPSSATLRCVVCGNPVELEECKTDEDGDAVHAACYVAKIGATKGAAAKSTPSRTW